MDAPTAYRWQSPVGEVLLVSCDGGLCMADWTASRRHKANLDRLIRATGSEIKIGASPVIEEALTQLSEYFDGTRKEFNLRLKLAGSDFQLRVWQALSLIPFGQAVSYRRFAQQLGYTRGVRAVAMAIGANPVSIILPCHRVIGYDGALTGYAGGLAVKQTLLDFERGDSLFMPSL